ncbi:MAG: hypothetical protein AB7G48_02375 [Nitrospiraceae bacterium]
MTMFSIGLVLTLILSGCSRPWRDQYFDKGLNKATQAEIEQMLGPPHTAKTSFLDEESIWTYRYAMTEDEIDPWGRFGRTAASAKDTAASAVGQGKDGASHQRLLCMKYTLKFNRGKVLQDWKRQPCVSPTQTATSPLAP